MGQPEQGADEPVERPIGRAVLQDLDMVETLAELQQHINELTFGILDCRKEESYPCDCNAILLAFLTTGCSYCIG